MLKTTGWFILLLIICLAVSTLFSSLIALVVTLAPVLDNPRSWTHPSWGRMLTLFHNRNWETPIYLGLVCGIFFYLLIVAVKLGRAKSANQFFRQISSGGLAKTLLE